MWINQNPTLSSSSSNSKISKDAFKHHGVKKVTVLAAISAPETPDNMKLIFERTQINELDDAIHVEDMKLGNILVAKQNHKAKLPCVVGKCTKKNGLWIKGNIQLLKKFKDTMKNLKKTPKEILKTKTW